MVTSFTFPIMIKNASALKWSERFIMADLELNSEFAHGCFSELLFLLSACDVLPLLES